MISYVASYVFIAIIWLNFHHLTRFVQEPPLVLVWLNFLHLFLVSLIPFATAWVAQTKLASAPVIVYTALFVSTASAFNVLEYQVVRSSPLVSEPSRRRARRRSLLALLLFGMAILGAALRPWIGFALICAALLLHVRPDIASPRRS